MNDFYLEEIDMPKHVDTTYRNHADTQNQENFGGTMGNGQLRQYDDDDLDSNDKYFGTKLTLNI